MDLSKTILSDIREVVLGSSEPSLFDTDLLMHINGATSNLNQNGIGKIMVIDDGTTWENFRDPTQIQGNEYFHMIPLFITLSVKLLFDPPPPSSVQYHSSRVDQLLWRLKLAYEDLTTGGVVNNDQTW